MRCRKAQEIISRSIDGELDGRESARLERHLAGCGECRALQADLKEIVRGAARLDVPEPSENGWLAVKAGLAAGQAKPSSRIARPERRPIIGWGLPQIRAASAAALVLVLVVSGLIVGRRLERGDAKPGPEARKAYTLAKLDEAERYYEQAVEALSAAFAEEKGALAPQVVELFDRNLSVIDATIQACRRAVLDEPEDLEARNYLMAAYTRKLTLLDSALDLQRGDRGAGPGKAII